VAAEDHGRAELSRPSSNKIGQLRRERPSATMTLAILLASSQRTGTLTTRPGIGVTLITTLQ